MLIYIAIGDWGPHCSKFCIQKPKTATASNEGWIEHSNFDQSLHAHPKDASGDSFLGGI